MKVGRISECSHEAHCNTLNLHSAIIGFSNQVVVFFGEAVLHGLTMHQNSSHTEKLRLHVVRFRLAPSLINDSPIFFLKKLETVTHLGN